MSSPIALLLVFYIRSQGTIRQKKHCGCNLFKKYIFKLINLLLLNFYTFSKCLFNVKFHTILLFDVLDCTFFSNTGGKIKFAIEQRSLTSSMNDEPLWNSNSG